MKEGWCCHQKRRQTQREMGNIKVPLHSKNVFCLLHLDVWDSPRTLTLEGCFHIQFSLLTLNPSLKCRCTRRISDVTTSLEANHGPICKHVQCGNLRHPVHTLFNISIFIHSGFFQYGRSSRFIFNQVIEFFCGKTLSGTNDYSKQSLFIWLQTCGSLRMIWSETVCLRLHMFACAVRGWNVAVYFQTVLKNGWPSE